MNAARRVSEREVASQMARINTDGGIGLLATPGQGAIGACLLTDCLGGMDDPAKWDWRGKIKTLASSLAEDLLFLRPIRPATVSKPLFIRAHPCHPWFQFFRISRSSRSMGWP